MADQKITELPVKTSSGIAATDYLLGIDSAEGYQMLIQDLGDYIINHVSATLGGSAQTLAAAITSATDKVNIVTGSDTIKTLTASDDLATLEDGHYRLSSAVPINAPSALASSSKYGYVTIQHRGAAAYTYYEYVAGNGNGTSLEHFHGWKSTATGPSITWINLDEDAPTIVNSGTTSSAAYTSLDDIPLNSVGQARFAADISPIGSEANLPYACFGSAAYRMIIVGRISSAENIYINTGNTSSWYGWKQLQFATA